MNNLRNWQSYYRSFGITLDNIFQEMGELMKKVIGKYRDKTISGQIVGKLISDF